MENKEKELSFKEKLERDIFTILNNIKFRYPIEDNHYVVTNLNDNNNISSIPADFRDYFSTLKVLEKNIAMYCNNDFINDKLTKMINEELNLIMNTSSLSLSLGNTYSSQYNTLVSITEKLNILKKCIESCVKQNNQQQPFKNNEAYVTNINGKYGVITLSTSSEESDLFLKSNYTIDTYRKNENHNSVYESVENGIPIIGLPNGLSEDEYFKIALLNSIQNIKSVSMPQYHNIENAILKLNKTLEKNQNDICAKITEAQITLQKNGDIIGNALKDMAKMIIDSQIIK